MKLTDNAHAHFCDMTRHTHTHTNSLSLSRLFSIASQNRVIHWLLFTNTHAHERRLWLSVYETLCVRVAVNESLCERARVRTNFIHTLCNLLKLKCQMKRNKSERACDCMWAIQTKKERQTCYDKCDRLRCIHKATTTE